jgi:hypothetical protein
VVQRPFADAVAGADPLSQLWRNAWKPSDFGYSGGLRGKYGDAMDNGMFVNIVVYIYIYIGVWVGGGSIYIYYYILTHIQHYDIWVYTSIYGQRVKFDEALDRRFSQEMGKLSSIP